MGYAEPKMYLQSEKQAKLQSNLNELGRLLESQETADRMLAWMLKMTRSELLELRESLVEVSAASGR